MAKLTAALVLVFRALRTDTVDLRLIAHLFSRQTTRYKSTLCKLYQIAFVLCAAGICRRTGQVCEVVLVDGYVDFQVVSEPAAEEPLGIRNLLNRQSEELEAVMRRRKEMKELFTSSVACLTVAFPIDESD
jgi:hypothetical protein